MIRLTNRGQTLIEIIIAIAVAVLVIAAIAQVATVGSRNATYSQTRTKASEYAQEATEWLRSQRDKNWNVFANHDLTYCINTLPADIGTLPATGTGTCGASYLDVIFQRTMRFEYISPNQRNITVAVSWTDSKGLHSVSVQTTLTNWRTL